MLTGKGDGKFDVSGRYVAGQGPTALVAGNLRTPDRVDVAVANTAGGTVSILRGGSHGAL